MQYAAGILSVPIPAAYHYQTSSSPPSTLVAQSYSVQENHTLQDLTVTVGNIWDRTKVGTDPIMIFCLAAAQTADINQPHRHQTALIICSTTEVIVCSAPHLLSFSTLASLTLTHKMTQERIRTNNMQIILFGMVMFSRIYQSNKYSEERERRLGVQYVVIK